MKKGDLVVKWEQVVKPHCEPDVGLVTEEIDPLTFKVIFDTELPPETFHIAELKTIATKRSDNS